MSSCAACGTLAITGISNMSRVYSDGVVDERARLRRPHNITMNAAILASCDAGQSRLRLGRSRIWQKWSKKNGKIEKPALPFTFYMAILQHSLLYERALKKLCFSVQVPYIFYPGG